MVLNCGTIIGVLDRWRITRNAATRDAGASGVTSSGPRTFLSLTICRQSSGAADERPDARAHVSAASDDADVDTRVATPFPTLAGTGIAGWFALVPTEHSSEQRALFHPLRGQPRPIRVRARAQGYLQQGSKREENGQP